MDELKPPTARPESDTKSSTEQRIAPRLMFVMGLGPQRISGIEKFLRYFARLLDSAGWDLVLCFDGPIATEFREYIASPNVRIESLNKQGDLGLSCAGELWKLLRKYKPQVFVYAFNGVMRCFPWLAKMGGCEQVFFNDHSSRPYGQAAVPLSLSRRIVGRFLTAPLTAIVSVAGFTRRTGDVLGVTSARNIVVPNGVEVCGANLVRGAQFRERYGISSKELVVTQVCWMVEVKGVDHMLRAAAMFLHEHSGVRFVFVGEGSELPKYKNLAIELGIQDAVIFTGSISIPTEMGVFDASDIYCQPSVWQEACPLAVLEAMSVKLPVIASNTGGLPEIVLDNKTGILVPVGSSEGIYAALERLMSDAGLRHEMGEAGYEKILKDHRIEDMARKYAEVFLGGNLE